jgi:hypothetical protein
LAGDFRKVSLGGGERKYIPRPARVGALTGRVSSRHFLGVLQGMTDRRDVAARNLQQRHSIALALDSKIVAACLLVPHVDIFHIGSA